MSAVLTPASAEPSAEERLARSRASLQRWVVEDQQAHAAAPSGDAKGLLGLRAHPMAAMALDAFGAWWSSRPLRGPTQEVAAAARSLLVPLLERRPVAVLGGAAAAGALLVWSRPWRSLLRPALLAGFASQLAMHAFAQWSRAGRVPTNERVR